MSLYAGKYIRSVKELKRVEGIFIQPDEEDYTPGTARALHHRCIIALSKQRLEAYRLPLSDKAGESFEYRRPHTRREKKKMAQSPIWIAVRNGCLCDMDAECHEDCHFGAVYSNLGQYMSREILAQYPELEKDDDGDWTLVSTLPDSQEHQVFDSTNPVHMYQLIGYIDNDYFDVLSMLKEDAKMDPRLCKALRRLEDLIHDDPSLEDLPYINQQHLHDTQCEPPSPIAVGVYAPDRSGRGPAKRSNWHVFPNVHDFVKQLWMAAYAWPRAWDDDNNTKWMLEADWVIAQDEEALQKKMVEHQMANKTDCPCTYLSLCQSMKWDENPRKVRKLYEETEGKTWPYCMQCIPMDCRGQRSIVPYCLPHKEPYSRRMAETPIDQVVVVHQ